MLTTRSTAALAALLATTTALPHHNPHSTSSWSNTEHLIAFGDSYTYVQGTAGLQNYSFIGDLQNFSFTPSELVADRIVQNQIATAEGGPNWVEFLTDCALTPGLYDPQTCGDKQLWDFAFAGSDISEEYLPLHHNFTVSLVNQILQFQEYAQPVLQDIVDPSKTLVIIWIGINDIGDSAELDVDFPSFYNELITTEFASAQMIHDLGYRDFLFMKLPPLNRTPPNLIRAAGPLPNATMIEWWDETLMRHAWEFEERNGERTNVMVYDTTGFLNYVLDHPSEFGVVNTTDYCAAYDQPFINTDPGMYGCEPLEEYL